MAADTSIVYKDLREYIAAVDRLGELRVVNGKNIMDLNEDELKRTRDALHEAGLPVISIAWRRMP